MKHLLLFTFPALAISLHAQDTVPLVDLTMSDNGKGQVEFRIRTSGDFDEVMSSVTFTVRWPASAGLALDTAVRCYPFQDVIPVSATAPVVNDGWMYRTFNGFSLSLLSDFGLSWLAGREYPICTADILVPGTPVELGNDAWTASHNCDFFASLGGWEATGAIYDSPEPDVAIRTEDQGTGNLDIILTPETDFFGWVTDLDFTVRWPGSGVSLGTTLQNEEVAEYLPIGKIGPEVTAGGFTYQRFHGEGIKSIANSDDAWHAGVGVTALSVPIFGTRAQGIGVVNDEWTTANSGNYTIKLNSHGHTGLIEGIALGLATAPKEPFEATVSSAANGFNLALDLPSTSQPTTISLHNAAGQAIWSATRQAAHGRMNLIAETGPVCDGLYILSVRHGERSLTKRVVR